MEYRGKPLLIFPLFQIPLCLIQLHKDGRSSTFFHKKRGRAFLPPLSDDDFWLKSWNFISRSSASAGPRKPCRGGPQLDTDHKNKGRISLLPSENTYFPSIFLQKLDFWKA